MQNFPIHPSALIASFWKNRSLIRTLVVREVAGRYRGSYMGILWSFFNPVFMLLVYTFVFSVIFKARWTAGNDSKTEFALVLFAGLLVFNLFAECVGRAPGLILSNVNYVKKVIFPLDILPWVSLGSALFHTTVSLVVWLIAHLILFGLPHVTVLWLPLVLTPLILLIMSISWVLASLGVFLRDVSQFIGIAITTLMFLSPIFYPAASLPEDYRYLIYANPMTPAIEMTRDVMYWGKSPNLTLLFTYTIFATVLAWLGFAWFQKTRKGFADVL
jgi:lipopolysaccharide transport system permease protein